MSDNVVRDPNPLITKVNHPTKLVMTNEEQLPSLTPEEIEQIRKEAEGKHPVEEIEFKENRFRDMNVHERQAFIAGATLYARRGKRDREELEAELKKARKHEHVRH